MTLYDTYDRTIYELLRLALVAAEYLPDQTLYSTSASWDAAIKVAQAASSDKLVTQIYGVGMWRGRPKIDPNIIVLNRLGDQKGTIGAFPAYNYVDMGNGTFNKTMYPRATKDLIYTIRIITKMEKWDRLLRDLVESVFGIESFIHLIDPTTREVTTNTVFITQENDLDLSSTEMLERMVTLRIKDVFVTPNKVLQTGIVQLTEVDGDIIVQPQTQPSEFKDSENNL